MRTFSRRGHTSESHESWTRTWQLAYVRSRSASFHTAVDTFAKWPDWSEDIPRGARAEAQRLVKDARLLRWVGDQNSAQGVAPPPQFVWEQRCAFTIDCDHGRPLRAAPWRSARSEPARKWMQRFRRRWNLCLGKLPTKDMLPAETMQAKARKGVTKKQHSGAALRLNMRSAKRPPDGGRVIRSR